jgi:cellulose synthase/poly-beta-1,6-N-acetylglucosamine synthase-like glycosyltransferase
VFDADNLAHPKFLEVINRYANAGHTCIQGQRTAKNLDNQYAAADSLGEIYKNYIERYVPYLLGGSSVISGSGMATETNLYRAYLNSPEIEQGKHLWKKMLQEDKILQNFLLRRNSRISYAKDAICYDEKTTTATGVETQRSRWLFSYFQNVPNALGIIRRGILNLSLQQLYFGFVTLALPMFMQLAAAFLLFVVGLFVCPPMSLAIAVSVVVFALNILWVLKLDNAPDSVWTALWSAPGFVWRQLKGLLKMGNPDKNFAHTVHTKAVTIDELLKQEDEQRKN